MDEHLSEENIKHLIFREEPEEIKFPLYRSKFSEQVKKEVKNVKDCHRTMGFPSDFPTRGPSDYLKKGTGQIFKQEVEKVKYNFTPKAKVPRHDEYTKPIMKPQQNYINFNALQVIRGGPKHGSRKVWDSSKGYEIHFCISEPKFVYHKGFAKVPKFIKEMKKKLQEKQQKDEPIQKGIRLIPEEEKESILKALKNIWAIKQNEFQLMPVIVDTIPQLNKKSELEKELIALEKEIDILERHKQIYVTSSPEGVRERHQVQ